MNNFEQYVATFMNDFGAVGMTARAFDAQGTILADYTFGYRDLASQTHPKSTSSQPSIDLVDGALIDKDTVFGIASITKSFTVLAIMQLAERGIVDIDAAVSTYIPEFKNSGQDTISVRHLMNHSAGYFPQHRTTITEVAADLNIDLATHEDLAFDVAFAETGAQRIVDLLDSAATHCGKPGEQFSYSNDSYGLLTEIVRRFGGSATFEDYMQQHILQPLGMSRSTSRMVFPKEDENVATLYEQRDGKLLATHDFYDTAFVLMGGGAMKSTIDDLMRYVCLYMNAGGGVVGAERVTAMTTPSIRLDYQSEYGYGLAINALGDYTCVEHGGALTGVSSQMAWLPEKGIGVVVLCNTSNVPVSLVAKRLLAEQVGLRVEKADLPVGWFSDEMQAEIIGDYRSLEGDEVLVSVVDGMIRVSVNGADFEANPYDGNKLVVSKQYSNLVLEFNRDANGCIYCVRLGSRLLPKC